jgi:hypothetical protein
MDIKTLREHMVNKVTACESKMAVAKEKGAFDLFQIFSKEKSDTEITLYVIDKAMQDMDFYTANQVKEKLIEKVKAKKPDFALYFREESIDAALENTIGEAMDEVLNELFVGRVVNLVEAPSD